MEHRYVLGNCDYNGKKNCEVAITWKLKDGNFSMQANIGKQVGGQCIEEAVSLFPDDKKAQRMKEIWENWHLNDLTAGSPAQEQYLKDHKIIDMTVSHYDRAIKLLTEAGLNPDPNYNNYRYGTAWLKREIPEETIKEIESW